MSSFLSNIGSTVGKGVSDAGKGVGDIGRGVGKGVGDVGKGVTSTLGKGLPQGATGQPDSLPPPHKTEVKAQAQPSPGPVTQPSTEGSQTLFGSLGKGITDAGKQGTNLLGKGFSSGFEIASNLSKNTLDLQRNVATSIGGVGGTAIDAVVTVRAISSKSPDSRIYYVLGC